MSADLTQIEQRLTSVETALTQVRQKLGLAAPPVNWVETVSGSLADIPEEEYQQFLECCRNVRNIEDRTV